MDSAERNGLALRRGLRSAERCSEGGVWAGLPLNTPDSRSSALLCSVTARDHRRLRGVARAMSLHDRAGAAQLALAQDLAQDDRDGRDRADREQRPADGVAG